MFNSFLFQYKFIFGSELLVALLLFTFHLPLKKKAWLRIPLCLLGYYLICFLIPIGDYSYNWGYISFIFLLIFTSTIPFLKLIFDIPWMSVIFCAMAAYTTQHFSYECFNFFQNVFLLTDQNGIFSYGQGNQTASIFNPVVLAVYFWVYIDMYFFAYVCFASKIRRTEELKLKKNSFVFILMVLLIVDVLFNAYLTFYSYVNYDRTYMMFEELYNMICCLIILVVQFVFVRERKLEQQLSFFSNLLSQQRKQYEQNKANIERLNIKAHDLKHQILALGSKKEISKEELQDISEAVSLYDKTYQTESDALNIVLMEKENVCRKYGIQLSVIADGKCLSFLKESDIYALFGNALDNAIEASKSISQEKRYISLVISKRNSFIHVSVQNYYLGELKFENGLPLTKKKDKSNHGFGVKSMEIIVSKYNGDLSFQAKEGIFLLNIIIPVPAKIG